MLAEVCLMLPPVYRAFRMLSCKGTRYEPGGWGSSDSLDLPVEQEQCAAPLAEPGLRGRAEDVVAGGRGFDPLALELA
jgi:hypothetical protein